MNGETLGSILDKAQAALPSVRGQDFMQRYFGTQPGGGLINVYLIESDAFGVIGNSVIVEVLGTIKKSRRRGFRAAENLLRAHKILVKDERVLSISMGCDSLGNDMLIVTTMQGGPEEIVGPKKEAE